MSNTNYGKKFEYKFKEDFSKIPNSSIDRIYDSVSGMKGVKNICDFICYVYPHIYYLEVKSIRGNTFPFSNLTQYDKLVEKIGIPGVITGVIIWYIDNDKVIFAPIEEIKKMKEDNLKSINIRTVLDNYNVMSIPSVKKRVFMDSDYSVLKGIKSYGE